MYILSKWKLRLTLFPIALFHCPFSLSHFQNFLFSEIKSYPDWRLNPSSFPCMVIVAVLLYLNFYTNLEKNLKIIWQILKELRKISFNFWFLWHSFVFKFKHAVEFVWSKYNGCFFAFSTKTMLVMSKVVHHFKLSWGRRVESHWGQQRRRKPYFIHVFVHRVDLTQCVRPIALTRWI